MEIIDFKTGENYNNYINMGIFSKLFGGSKEASNTKITDNHPSDINQEADDVIEDKEIIVRKFFRTELYNPAKYIPLAYDSCETASGNMEYDIDIESPELGIFNRMIIIVFQSTSVANVIFIADNGRVTDELRLFINFLVKNFGADDYGKKELSKEDLEYLQRGVGTTRYWINHGISLDLNVDSTGEFEILFYGIKLNCNQI